jgi:hypothetical protein
VTGGKESVQAGSVPFYGPQTGVTGHRHVRSTSFTHSQRAAVATTMPRQWLN